MRPFVLTAVLVIGLLEAPFASSFTVPKHIHPLEKHKRSENVHEGKPRTLSSSISYSASSAFAVVDRFTKCVNSCLYNLNPTTTKASSDDEDNFGSSLVTRHFSILTTKHPGHYVNDEDPDDNDSSSESKERSTVQPTGINQNLPDNGNSLYGALPDKAQFGINNADQHSPVDLQALFGMSNKWRTFKMHYTASQQSLCHGLCYATLLHQHEG